MRYNSTEQTIAWFKDRAIEGNLDLKPPFQRRPVWTQVQKCHLVETILLGLPVPEVYIQVSVSPDGSSQYSVVDGQQRMRAVLQFIGVERTRDEARYNGYALEHLDTTSHWYNKTFDDLTDAEKITFYQHKFAVRQLSDTTDAEVRDMFARLNRWLSKLSDQELRNALYVGPFIQLANRLAEDPYWAENGVVSPAFIRRMGDIEFVSELLIGCMHGPQAGDGRTIDNYYAEYEELETEFPGQADAQRLFGRAKDTIEGVLPDLRKTRWKNRTDYYSLFVCIGQLLRNARLATGAEPNMRDSLSRFEDEVRRLQEDEHAEVSEDVKAYLEAAQRGSSDKSRRAARHRALLNLLSPFFVARQA